MLVEQRSILVLTFQSDYHSSHPSCASISNRSNKIQIFEQIVQCQSPHECERERERRPRLSLLQILGIPTFHTGKISLDKLNSCDPFCQDNSRHLFVNFVLELFSYGHFSRRQFLAGVKTV